MLSPPTQIASAPRPTSEATASRTAAEPSTFASSNSIPSSLQTVRATFVPASEFASDGFQATPTLASRGVEPPGHPESLGHRLHRPEADHVGRVLLRVVPRDADAGRDRVAHHPEDVQALRVAVGRGHRLEAGRRQGDDQLVVTADDRAGDRVRRRGVPLGAVPMNRDRPAFLVSRLPPAPPARPGPLPPWSPARRAGTTRRSVFSRATPTRPRRSHPPRGRSRSVSSNTADAARIKDTASHSRSKRLIIHESGRGEDVNMPAAAEGRGLDAGRVHAGIRYQPFVFVQSGSPRERNRTENLVTAVSGRSLSVGPAA